MKTVRVSPETVFESWMPLFYHKRTLFVKIFTIRDKENGHYRLTVFDLQVLALFFSAGLD